MLHHKYAVIDADKFSADQVVITGSHNWSSSAENSNNENTLIIHSSRIANLYLQEFKARYIEAGGTDIISDVKNNPATPTDFNLQQNYPNPFNPSTVISYQLPQNSFVTLKVYDILGREVATLVDDYQQAGNYNYKLSTSNYQLSSGVYFYALHAGNYFHVKKMLLMK